MQLSELREYIGENLGGRDDTATYTKITKEINMLLMQKLPRMRLKPFVKVTTALSCTINQDYVELPADFRQMLLAQWRELTTDDWEHLDALQVTDLENIDTGDTLYGQVILQSSGTWRLHLFQTPDTEFLLRVFYYAAETELSGDSDEANVSAAGFDDVLISGATFRVARRLKLADQIMIWGRAFRDDVAELREWQGNIWGVAHEFELRNLYV